MNAPRWMTGQKRRQAAARSHRSRATGQRTDHGGRPAGRAEGGVDPEEDDQIVRWTGDASEAHIQNEERD